MNVNLKLLIGLVLIVLSACSNFDTSNTNTNNAPSISIHEYGTLSTGENIQQYQLRTNNIRLNVITFGGIITHLEVPDKNGVFADVVLGFDDLASYEHKNRFFGAIIGRYANRISHGKAHIDGTDFQLTTNRKAHQLHGGNKGFDKVVWQAKTAITQNTASIVLSYSSADGEEGYPGKLEAKITYEINNAGELSVIYEGNTNKTTVFNPTQHSYFNLSGIDQSVLKHELTIHAADLVELDSEGIPTGQLLSVKNTAFDFLSAKEIGLDIHSQNSQLKAGKGYDHYFRGKRKRGKLTPFAELYEPYSGRKMTVSTTEIGAQLYSANYLEPSVIGKGGVPYQARQGICIETGQMPNAPGEVKFNTVLVQPNRPFFSKTVFAFTNH
jgi:aldose 1-epimerase